MSHSVSLLTELQACLGQKMVKTNGRAVTTRRIEQHVYVPEVRKKCLVVIPAGAEIHYQPGHGVERLATDALVFIGDASGSVLRVRPKKPNPTVLPMLRGRLRLAALAGEERLFPKDYREARRRWSSFEYNRPKGLNR